jgi:hypothetical protein
MNLTIKAEKKLSDHLDPNFFPTSEWEVELKNPKAKHQKMSD